VSTSATAVPLAATVLLARGPGSAEVFVVRRAETLRFMGGFQAFPGGRVSLDDAVLAGVPRLFQPCLDKLSVAKFSPTLRQLPLQPRHDARVHLAHTRLA
jgi:8-oxo-dGTP pyrophosphatase MutT (NUDIX family)